MSANHADEARLRRAIAIAALAGETGELPFGALIVGRDGQAIAEASSTELSTRDWTCHAEMNAIRVACRTASSGDLAGATLYASSECCAMCAAAAFHAGVRRIVFGFPEASLRKLLAADDATTGLGFSCREILATAPEPVEIHGPCLEEEAAQAHSRFWSPTSDMLP